MKPDTMTMTTFNPASARPPKHARATAVPVSLMLALLLGALSFGATVTPASAQTTYPEPGGCLPTAVTHDLLIVPGVSGEGVRHAQCLLNLNWDYDLAEDGIYGPKTEAAIREIQEFTFESDDGIIGPCTWTILHSPDALPAC